ncbi:hypothetical protein ACVIKP_006884 [Rhizobium leguminosarum]|jgi:hypothetical protein
MQLMLMYDIGYNRGANLLGGRVCAIGVIIQGRSGNHYWLRLRHCSLVVAGVASVYSIDDLASAPSQLLRLVDPSCNIKGNISINSGWRPAHR